MKILLINPPVLVDAGRKDISAVIDNLFYNSPPLGLAYLAAVLERSHCAVSIIDAAVEQLSISQVAERVECFNPDWIGLTATTNLFDCAVTLARRLKERFPKVIIVLGGPHVSVNPQHALSFDCFDVGVIGEGERTVVELNYALSERMDFSGIDGLVFRRDGRLVFTSPREAISNLDELPYPARHLLPMHLYKPQPNDQYVLPKVSMIAGRGCPFQCIFCDKSVFGQSYRSFSPAYIVSEMEHLVRSYGARDIAFLDSIFTINAQRVEAIVDEIKKHRLKVNWTCTAKANVLTEALLKKMKDAGCWRIRLGIESGSDEVLSFIRKDITTRQVSEAARWADKLGIQTKGFFMIGHLIDTPETIEKTIQFALSLPLKDITVQINTPMFNTSQWQMCSDYGQFLTENYQNFSYWEPVFIPRGLSKEYLLKAYARFYRSFYLRPIIVWRHLCHIRDWQSIWKYPKAFFLMRHLFLRGVND